MNASIKPIEMDKFYTEVSRSLNLSSDTVIPSMSNPKMPMEPQEMLPENPDDELDRNAMASYMGGMQ